jgi:hypothetical protein
MAGSARDSDESRNPYEFGRYAQFQNFPAIGPPLAEFILANTAGVPVSERHQPAIALQRRFFPLYRFSLISHQTIPVF